MLCISLKYFVPLIIFLTVVDGIPIGAKREMVTIYKTFVETVTIDAATQNPEVYIPLSTNRRSSSSETLRDSSKKGTLMSSSTTVATSLAASETSHYSTRSSTLKSRSKTSSSPSVPTSTYTNHIPNDAFENTLNEVWDRFWLSEKNQWNDDDSICDTNEFSEPVVWNQAVIGKAITNSKNTERIEKTAEAIYKYKNKALGVYSATTAGDDDIYNDDNAQLVWVFVDGYKATGNEKHLEAAKEVMQFLMTQWNSQGKGGVIWKYKADYIASISTVEAALAAIRLYTITSDIDLLKFTEDCMDFMFEYFQDTDKLFFDGLNKNNYDDINKGKLSYTAGCALSTLAYLSKYSSKSNWKSKAIEIGKAAMNRNGALYNGNSIWNNQLKYVHLLYAGYVDLLTLTDWDSEYSDFKQELLRQGSLMIEFLQDPDDKSLYFGLATGATKKMFQKYEVTFKEDNVFEENKDIYCNGNMNKPTKKSLMNNGSAAQILFEVSRIF